MLLHSSIDLANELREIISTVSHGRNLANLALEPGDFARFSARSSRGSIDVDKTMARIRKDVFTALERKHSFADPEAAKATLDKTLRPEQVYQELAKALVEDSGSSLFRASKEWREGVVSYLRRSLHKSAFDLVSDIIEAFVSPRLVQRDVELMKSVISDSVKKAASTVEPYRPVGPDRLKLIRNTLMRLFVSWWAKRPMPPLDYRVAEYRFGEYWRRLRTACRDELKTALDALPGNAHWNSQLEGLLSQIRSAGDAKWEEAVRRHTEISKMVRGAGSASDKSV